MNTQDCQKGDWVRWKSNREIDEQLAPALSSLITTYGSGPFQIEDSQEKDDSLCIGIMVDGKMQAICANWFKKIDPPVAE